jgi:hypothetical protein
MTTRTDNKIRTSNATARKYVQALLPFRGNNTFGEWRLLFDAGASLYVVCSYGPHWPLFIYDPSTQRWYENKSKYGRATSKHHTQLHPHCEEPTVTLHVEDMIKVANGGITAII